MKRFTGVIFWVKLDKPSGTPQRSMEGDIDRAILNDNIFTLGINLPNPAPNCDIRLRSKDGFIFEGSGKFIDSPKSSAIVSFDYYSNQKQAFLFGSWIEDKVEYMCFVKLKEVDSFDN